MNQTVLNRYFELSDLAGNDPAAFRELIDCFAEDASVTTARGDEISGKAEIEKFYEGFFRMSRDLKHLWNTSASEDRLKADWAVVGRRPDGSLFAFSGEDLAELDGQGKIRALTVRFK